MNLLRIFLFLTLVTFAHAAPLSSETLRIISDRYLAKEILPILPKGFSMEEALRAQAAFVEILKPHLGPVVGYKIGLITKQGQERMGATGPVHAVLLKKMLLPNNSKVPPNFGARPALELDMGVFVKDEGINNARNLSEVVPHLSDLVCFIELIDSIAATNQPMDGALLTAINVGARAGIIGQKRKITPALVEALPQMKMTLLDEDGKILAEVPKLNLQPLENIPWLAADLKKSGTPLKKGDFISLGSPAAIQLVMPGKKITLRYDGLPGGPMTANVSFTR